MAEHVKVEVTLNGDVYLCIKCKFYGIFDSRKVCHVHVGLWRAIEETK